MFLMIFDDNSEIILLISNIGSYEELTKTIFQLSSNLCWYSYVDKYTSLLTLMYI